MEPAIGKGFPLPLVRQGRGRAQHHPMAKARGMSVQGVHCPQGTRRDGSSLPSARLHPLRVLVLEPCHPAMVCDLISAIRKQSLDEP